MSGPHRRLSAMMYMRGADWRQSFMHGSPSAGGPGRRESAVRRCAPSRHGLDERPFAPPAAAAPLQGQRGRQPPALQHQTQVQRASHLHVEYQAAIRQDAKPVNVIASCPAARKPETSSGSEHLLLMGRWRHQGAGNCRREAGRRHPPQSTAHNLPPTVYQQSMTALKQCSGWK